MPVDYAGNSLGTARGLDITSSTQTFRDYVGSLDTQDYYSFTLSNHSSFNLSLNGMTKNANVQLLNSSGTVLQSSAKTRARAESINSFLDAGTYYIQVSPSTKRNSTSYNLGVSATPSVYKYNFNYYYNGSSNSSDYYTGYVYAKAGTYAIGSYYDYSSSSNETGANGKYYISDATLAGSTFNLKYELGKVYVNSYYDSETNSSYTTIKWNQRGSAGVSYLGSESDSIINGSYTDAFGSDYYKADVPYYKYNFTYYYNVGKYDYYIGNYSGNGDFYTGYVYAKAGTYATYSYYDHSSSNNETGVSGKYYISSASSGYDSYGSYLNKVYVSSYYDNESNSIFTPYNYSTGNSSGSNGLGSEYDHIGNYGNNYDSFGNDYYEADGIFRYSFTYYYNGSSSNSDYYTGYVYAMAGTYTTGSYYDYSSNYNQAGANGKYYISGVTTAGRKSDLGTVYVSSYYDSETSSSYTPSKWNLGAYAGWSYLGTEHDSITNGTTYDFGYDYYEADVPIYKYSYTYYYNGSNNNSDSYTGYVYAKAGTYTRESYYDYSSSTNEIGFNGKYYISGIIGVGSTSDLGKVYVSSYYDSESNKNYTFYSSYLNTGTSYLGSEYGYLLTTQISSSSFGRDYQEADIII